MKMCDFEFNINRLAVSSILGGIERYTLELACQMVAEIRCGLNTEAETDAQDVVDQLRSRLFRS